MKNEVSKKQQIYKYQIKLDITKDAYNWYVGCNTIGHGIDWKQGISPEIVKNIYNKPEVDVYRFINNFLKQKYIDDKKQIDEYIKFINHEFKNKFDEACNKMIEMMDKPLYRNDFTVYLTTFPRGPYNYSEGSLWIFIGWTCPIKNFLHELLHFQCFHYYRKDLNSEVSKLTNEQYEFLKESLTVIIDEDLYPLIFSPDHGYPMHQEFRKELHKFWKSNKNFDELVNFSLKLLPDFATNL